MATHTVMPKKLAQALMEAGMQHFDAGGGPTTVEGAGNPNDPTIAGNKSPDYTMQYMQHNNVPQGVGNMFKGVAADFTAQNMFQAAAPDIQTQDYSPALTEQYGNQQNIYGQQQNLANTLLAQSQGYGPNIAQAQLNQATGQNAAQQAALMAGQRGASSNPALLARQAAMQGAGAQQQAVGQSATLQAQQQMAAQQALAQQQSSMANQSLQAQSILQGARAQQNNAVTQGSLGAQGINAQVAGQNASAVNQTLGGFLGAGGSLISSVLNKGGTVKKMSDGGSTFDHSSEDTTGPTKDVSFDELEGDSGSNPVTWTPPSVQAAAPISAPSGGGMSIPTLAPMQGVNPNISGGGGGGGGGGGIAGLMALLNKGGATNELMKKGGSVPGKSTVPGNSPKNDTVPTLLSPGEEVIDRETLQDPGPIGKAARMVAKHINAKKEGKDNADPKAQEFMKHLKKKKGFDTVVQSRKACGGGKM